jgi:hypothetical protein
MIEGFVSFSSVIARLDDEASRKERLKRECIEDMKRQVVEPVLNKVPTIKNIVELKGQVKDLSNQSEELNRILGITNDKKQ